MAGHAWKSQLLSAANEQLSGTVALAELNRKRRRE